MKRKLNIKTRLKEPSPAFFKKVKKIGLLLGAAGTAVLAAPIALPVAITTAAGYLVTAGLVASAVSAATVEGE
ncbi:hypothetical protein [Desertivirga arenae]|uniref:hypothetical protein n=1 Tax=Desertivirga arenae TaxID=2810309 RepID=UPI001A9779D8|nr:hypothetical protein [Pedobacter sp. SYSU D00823]